MQLLLLRHGKAEDSSPGGDFTRELEEKGHEQARNVARILAAADLLPDLVLSSPVIRAKQTANTFTSTAGMPGPIFLEWLACGMSPETALAELSHFPEFERIMIVGHEPDMGDAIASFLGLEDTSPLNIRKATLTGIEAFSLGPGAGVLDFCLPARLA